jgi:carbon monoxide dehydrogenase subunit G
MKLEQSFTVAAPLEAVWAALIDVERVAPCLPGAQIDEKGPGGIYEGQFTVKLGPTTAAYYGTLRMQELDEGAHVAVMSARGTDRRGQGGATATIRSTLRPDGDGTKVDVDTDFAITGRLARFGRGGMIEEVSKRLLREFAACLQATLTAPPAEAGAATPAAAPVAPFDPGSGAPPPPAPGPIPVPGPPGAGDAGAMPPPPPPAVPPDIAGGARPGVGPGAPGPGAPPRPLDAIELVRGVLKERLTRLWQRLGRWLRSRGGRRGRPS